MKLSAFGQDYLDHIKHERGLTPRTCEMYQARLHHHLNWLDDNGYKNADVEVFSTPVIRRYLYSLSARGLRPRTIHGLFDPLRGLGNFLVEHGVLAENPVLALKMPKKDAAQRLTISKEEIEALLEAVERQHDPRHAAMSRAILYALVFCGLRAQDGLDLKVAHVSLDNKTLLVASGKGRKSRMLYPTAECLAALSEWLLVREKDCTHDWLWAEDRGRRVGYEGLRKMLEEIKCLAGLRDHANIKCHSIRHFFATHLLERGASIKQIQAALGHSMAQTTFVYLHLGEAESKAMANLASLDSVKPAPALSHPALPQKAQTSSKDTLLEFNRRRRQGSIRPQTSGGTSL